MIWVRCLGVRKDGTVLKTTDYGPDLTDWKVQVWEENRTIVDEDEPEYPFGGEDDHDYANEEFRPDYNNETEINLIGRSGYSLIEVHMSLSRETDLLFHFRKWKRYL